MALDTKDKVLVVDNHPVILKYVSDLLQKHGYQVETAQDGLSALDRLETFSPDVILIDLIMPNIDGASLCRIIRRDPRFRKTPLFVLSAAAAEESCNLRAIGADLCIAKGPLPEMGRNVLHAVAHSDDPTMQAEGQVLGVNSLYPRQITGELLTANRHLESVLEHISDGILEISRDGRIIHTNSRAAAYLSSTREEMLGSDFLSWFEGKNRKVASRLVKAETQETKTEAIRQEQRYLSIRAIPMAPDESVRVILLTDVTEYERTRKALEKANKEQKLLARTDPLTKIANRRWFDDRLKAEWKRMRREKGELALVLCDVDNFKEFNDRNGHMAGDRCLKAVGRAIAAQTKRPADLAARYGGDEFALILPNTSVEGAKHIADALSREVWDLELRGQSGNKSVSISLSIGIAIGIPGGEFTIEDLLSIADAALYEAKNQGRNRVVVRGPATPS